jgi:hypothetical protein
MLAGERGALTPSRRLDVMVDVHPAGNHRRRHIALLVGALTEAEVEIPVRRLDPRIPAADPVRELPGHHHTASDDAGHQSVWKAA